MSPEQVKLREIFSEALTKASTEERERYLAAACGDDTDLRRQMNSLLEAHGQSGDFLKQNVIAPNGPPVGEGPGSVIGRYKLLQQIGEGGFGVVFMAEQQEPVRRMVALKIIKAGMDTKEVVARFEAGRQALALMDHPNIARVLDGGATDSGRPFFVMELIKGIPITEFCDQHQLPTEARLRLFMKVCAGVQHAHQKGVIHRDLKPSNVLVTLHDGEPVPKVIDFGIAKALGQKLTERTLFTRFEQLIGTPAYMSPEQAEWSGLDIDTRSDLYSLGVLLYELLTGTTPLEKETLARAALDEMRRMIRETEPPKPSTRLETGLRGQKSEVGSQRSEVSGQTAHSQPSTLNSQLSDCASLRRRLQAVRGDLDWIVMKALEKDRTRRYETVNGLARDIERHLNGEPVVACPPSKAYRAAKFIRKHRISLSAVMAVVLALATGLALALFGLKKARSESRRAQSEAAVAKAVSDFLMDDLLGRANPFDSPNPDLKVRDALDRASEKIKERFTNQPLVEASIRLTLGNTYHFLDEMEAAEQNVRRAVAIRTEKLGPDHPATLDARGRLYEVLSDSRKSSEAEEVLRSLAQASERTLGPEHPKTLGYLADLGERELEHGRLDRAEAIIRNVLTNQQRVLGAEHEDTFHSLGSLARVYQASGQPWGAAELHEAAFHGLLRLNGLQHPFTQFAKCDVACDYVVLGDYTKAIGAFREIAEYHRRRFGPHNNATWSRLSPLAGIYGRTGAWSSCAGIYREILDPMNKLHPDELLRNGFNGAVAALLAGDTTAYRELAERLLVNIASTTNSDWACEAATACFLTANSVTNLEPALRLADSLPERQGEPAGIETCLNRLCKGMGDYRRGDFSGALQHLDGWRQFPAIKAAAQAGYFCAMSHFRQGDTNAAKADLVEAGKNWERLTRRGDLGGAWPSYGLAATARGEAERLILGQEVSPRLDAGLLESSRRQWEPYRHHVLQAEDLAGQRKWPEARAEYLAALREPVFTWEAAEDGDGQLAQRMGIVFLLAGDHAGAEQLCRDWLERLRQRPDPLATYLAVRLCLAGEHDATSEWGQLAFKAAADMAADPRAMGWVRAMMAYRLGHYQEAIQNATATEASERLAIRTCPQIFRAMALAKSGELAEGRKCLAQTEAQLGGHLATMTGDVWWDLGLCQLAIDEAHRLFAEAATK